jgi:hypothetical protein
MLGLGVFLSRSTERRAPPATDRQTWSDNETARTV